MCTLNRQSAPSCTCIKSDCSMPTPSGVPSLTCVPGTQGCYSGCCALPTCQTTTLLSPGYMMVSSTPTSFLNLTAGVNLVSPDCTKAFGIAPNGKLAIYNVVDGSTLVEFGLGGGQSPTYFSISQGSYNIGSKNSITNVYTSNRNVHR